MDCSPLSSSVHGILQARILEWVAISFSIYVYIHIYVHYKAYIYIYIYICQWYSEKNYSNQQWEICSKTTRSFREPKSKNAEVDWSQEVQGYAETRKLSFSLSLSVLLPSLNVWIISLSIPTPSQLHKPENLATKFTITRGNPESLRWFHSLGCGKELLLGSPWTDVHPWSLLYRYDCLNSAPLEQDRVVFREARITV